MESKIEESIPSTDSDLLRLGMYKTNITYTYIILWRAAGAMEGTLWKKKTEISNTVDQLTL
mgnify:CR=1 FL=1